MIKKGAFLLFILVFIFSCKKESNAPPSSPQVVNTPKDTLSTGWSVTNLTMSSLNGVDIMFKDKNTGYLIGGTSFSWLFKTVDGGLNWSEVTVATMPTSRANFMNIGLVRNKVFIVTLSNRLYTITNDNQLDSTNIVGGPVSDVQFINNDTGYLVGSNSLWRSADAGVSWKRIFSAVIAPTYSTLYFRNSNTGWFGLTNNFYATNNTDTVFNTISIPRGFSWNSIYAPSNRMAYLTTSTGLYKHVMGSNSVEQVSLPFTIDGFSDLYFESESVGYLSTGNRIMKTIDGGQTWKIEVALVGATKIVEMDAKEGMIWACCTSGKVLRYKL